MAKFIEAAETGLGVSKGVMVELRGVEPLTSSMRTTRSTS